MNNTSTYILLILVALSTNINAQENYILLHNNGSIKVKGNLVDGKKNGLWMAYDSAENLIIKREYDNNSLVKNYLSNTETKEETTLNQEDILWSKRIYRILPSSYLQNNAIYKNQKFKNSLVEYIKNNQIISYASRNLDSVLTQENALKILDEMELSTSNFGLKEDWFFNKKTSQMDFIIVSLFLVDEKTNTSIYFYYPELKKYLYNNKVIIEDKKSNFENYFQHRLYKSEITKESNVTERGMTRERAKEIEKLLLETEIEYWFKNN